MANADDMDNIIELNKTIKQKRMQIADLMYNERRRCADVDVKYRTLIERMRTHTHDLTRQRNREAERIYVPSNKDRPLTARVRPQPMGGIISISKPKVSTLTISKNSTTLIMTPNWFKSDDDESKVLENIIYPDGAKRRRPFDTIARYRNITNASNDFNLQPLVVGENSIETLIVVLDAFVQQFGGKLSFTQDHFSYEQSAHRTACGIADIGSVHLLANAYIPSAKFILLVNIHYDDLAKSEETMKTFVMTFSDAIAKYLCCEHDFVRILSVGKSKKALGKTDIDIVLTTPNKEKTKELADLLKLHARSGFVHSPILRRVVLDEYPCKLIPIVSYLQLRSTDFDPRYNIDYTQSGFSEVLMRGGLPYHLPIGWYRHGLKLDDKYKDNSIWFGSSNIPGEWPIAFHGTYSHALKNITERGSLPSNVIQDSILVEAITQIGVTASRPAFYVTTHCNGGSHPYYTEDFHLSTTSDQTETFQLVFQCRVRPDAFTCHTRPVRIGEAWRLVDSQAVRPFGILLKNINTKVPYEEE